jgi:hypothetical protein
MDAASIERRSTRRAACGSADVDPDGYTVGLKPASAWGMVAEAAPTTSAPVDEAHGPVASVPPALAGQRPPAPIRSVRPPSPSGSGLEGCFHDPATALRASTMPPPRRASTMPPHPVLLVLEGQRRPSMRPSGSPPPSIAPSRPSLAALAPSRDAIGQASRGAESTLPWAKVALAALVIPALVALASWFYYA